MNEGSVPLDVRPLRERLADLADSFEDPPASGAALSRAGLGDGLPLVAPTAARITGMLEGATADAPATSAPLPPGYVVPTLWDVAACAVLAGCEPGALPLLVAALEAMTDPAFNLLGVQATTGAAAPLTIVHGPAVEELGLHDGHNALGPGSGPNAVLGRALRLVLQDVALAIPGSGDMATHGHPGKYTWLVAEPLAGSPWPPLHTTRGLDAPASAVTVVAGVGNIEVVLPLESPEALVTTLAHSMTIAGNAGALSFGGGQALVLLPPECAQFLDGHSWDRSRLQQALFAEARAPLDWLSAPAAQRVRQARTEQGLPPDEPLPAARSAEDILVVATGGVGVKATFIPTWGASTEAVTRPILPVS